MVGAHSSATVVTVNANKYCPGTKVVRKKTDNVEGKLNKNTRNSHGSTFGRRVTDFTALLYRLQHDRRSLLSGGASRVPTDTISDQRV